MKVQCDYCNFAAASLFCFADEAALCDSCDRKIHRANKVASKHRRFSLLQPSSGQAASQLHPPTPLCDICQKKRGFLFCKEDRAILCRDCDLPIHTASDLTRDHTRYLLTGVRLSSAPISHAPTNVDSELENGSIDNLYSQDEADISVLTKTTSDANSRNVEYSINAWHVEENLFNNLPTTSNTATITPMTNSDFQYYQQRQENHHGLHEAFPVWASQGQFYY
ncbi:hypothetical protein LUZ61_010309 [Rhynchospora tenuis]|uniref:B box-type domain-containing protein n=1 Tax=Rhynchospora tenuis TaxID=198213 RepID=A0AAD5ZZ85_9POAL|nr:hypothetical protein LUZ61_010309 [Rhynchospora tenuis]